MEEKIRQGFSANGMEMLGSFGFFVAAYEWERKAFVGDTEEDIGWAFLSRGQ